jgi:hypothetical protein
MNSAKADNNEKGLQEKAADFREMGDYKDAAALAEECETLAEQIKAEKNERYESLVERLKIAQEKTGNPDVDEFLDLSNQFAELGDYKKSKALSKECVGIAQNERQRQYNYRRCADQLKTYGDQSCETADDYRGLADKYKALGAEFKALADCQDAPELAARCEESAAWCIQEADKIIAKQNKKKLTGIYSALGVAGIVLIIYIALNNVFVPNNTLDASGIPHYIAKFIVGGDFQGRGFLGALLLSFVPLAVGAVVSSIIFSICNNEKKILQIVFITAICGMLLYFIFGLNAALLSFVDSSGVNLDSIINIGFLFMPLLIAITVSMLTLLVCGMDSGDSFVAMLLIDIVYSIICLVQILMHYGFGLGKLILFLILCAIAAVVAILPGFFIAVITSESSTPKAMRSLAVVLAVYASISIMSAYPYVFYYSSMLPFMLLVLYIVAFILVFREKTRVRVIFAILVMILYGGVVGSGTVIHSIIDKYRVDVLLNLLIPYTASMITPMIWPKLEK